MRTDICVAVPVSNRRHEEIQSLVGYFINVIALRTDVDLRGDFLALLSDVRAGLLEGQANQECPFDLVMRELRIARGTHRNPFFQVKCAEHLATTGVEGIALGGVDGAPARGGFAEGAFRPELRFQVVGSGIECSFTYARDLIDEEIVLSASRALIRIGQRSWLRDPRRRLADLELPEHDGRVGPSLERPFASSLLDAWFRSVDRWPNAPSLFVNGRSVDYRELDTRSSALARRLVERDVAVGSVVCLHAERTEEFVIGVLGGAEGRGSVCAAGSPTAGAASGVSARG